MKRRTLLGGLTALALVPLRHAAAATQHAVATVAGGESLRVAFEPLKKPNAEWRKLLEHNRFEILFEEDTERAFTSPLNDEKRPGNFICAACYLPLFESRHKYDSGTGWPSFTQPIEGTLAKKTDFKLIFPRTEYHCERCGGHQGHLFKDGPKPRGERWCNNGLALLFVPADEPFPPLRT